jgi:hypothetical protein
VRIPIPLLVAFLCFLSYPTCCAEQPCVYVQRNIEWQATENGYEVGNGSVIGIDADHNVLKLYAQFFREAKGHGLALDFKSGYLVMTGTWTRTDQDHLAVNLKERDSYKYFALGHGNPAVKAGEIWTMSGGPPQPFSARINVGSDRFMRTSDLKGVDDLYALWSHFVVAANIKQ